ncbi:hypothetical protein AcW1_002083 [Taiwanofungus camphoratus]|nr:hypothetical protein AcW1_002083 [Antrodia cinnamomea]KAI0945993.1 hypothetical protein AcV7_010088 [Antrodia cinnamomea]
MRSMIRPGHRPSNPNARRAETKHSKFARSHSQRHYRKLEKTRKRQVVCTHRDPEKARVSCSVRGCPTLIMTDGSARTSTAAAKATQALARPLASIEIARKQTEAFDAMSDSFALPGELIVR